jgi:ATP-dependent RNA helicase DDX51/DBP6
VIDEADRLLAQSYQDWLAQVLLAIRAPTDSRRPTNPTSTAAYPYPDAMSPAFLPDSLVRADIDEKKQVSCQKLLFSATLTKDPGKIAALELRDSKYFVVQSGGRNVKDGIMGIVMEKFTFPASLTVRSFR